MAGVFGRISPVPVGGEPIKIADVQDKWLRDKGLDADVLWKLRNRAEVDKNLEDGQRLTVRGINDRMASFMPSSGAK